MYKLIKRDLTSCTSIALSLIIFELMEQFMAFFKGFQVPKFLCWMYVGAKHVVRNLESFFPEPLYGITSAKLDISSIATGPFVKSDFELASCALFPC